jgi:hypothetical protein
VLPDQVPAWLQSRRQWASGDADPADGADGVFDTFGMG